MQYSSDPSAWPSDRPGPEARLTDLFAEEGADVQLAGIPSDVAVIGRRGARDGPTGIRDAMRFVAGLDTRTGNGLRRTIHDHGNMAGLDDHGDDVLALHDHVRSTLRPIMGKDTIILGGDHGLTFPVVAALADATDGPIGIVVVDAHYDLRDWIGQPTSGTPFRRILEDLPERVQGSHIVEIGIRPFANSPVLADVAREHGVRIHTRDDVREHGIGQILDQVVAELDVEHIWLTIDIDGLDQSVASGCSAPGAGGLSYTDVEEVVRRIGSDPRCRGMDIMEVAPSLDPTGNTCRVAAQLVATYMARQAP